MSQIAPLTLDDGTIIYIEVNENTPVIPPREETTREFTREDYGRGSKGISGQREPIAGGFQAIEGTIAAYTTYTLNAFKKIANANIDKVTLEFGVKLAGKAGIPYITEGSAESNLKITVECSFREDKSAGTDQGIKG